jgi:hypothetical protein
MVNTICNISNSIKISLDNEAFYAALITTLTLPDICGKIEYPNKTPKDRYIDWFNKYLYEKYNQRGYNNSIDFLVAENCYALRCSLLHEGETEILTQKSRKGDLNRIFFHTNKYDTGHCNLNPDGIEGLFLNINRFCYDVIEAVENWLKDIENDSIKCNKIHNMIKILDA